ncbi:MAG TPA: DUF2256 domain-containing protein [Erythrobacter sp.]|nr:MULTISPECIES: DUF2256 domain-containing protein [Erythrobacteraceae]MAG05016.1 DUF2256 domain-containing protein [Sphingomonadaceae bacterium]MBN92083.1 DUF2256 domain-containing protein [Erythrobacteraceae bacterium]MCZ4265092.1 DUF2256 domain-containing protein [Erythrobacter sp. G21629-S1]RZP20546.1 MAG: DUF2256 domain-containing protein [Erythrobacter sp.]MAG06404.1 DUF2256 domain-containing protein [Sphingomonadaceae bacterium]
MRRMGDLPSKTCLTCGFPFTWRKKWARDWEGVKYCSDKCRRNKPSSSGEAAGPE